MKVVNPIGRKIDTKAAAYRACYCGTSSTFASANTENGSDTCWHCGCSCDMIADGSTWQHAQVTFRTSSL